MLGFTSNIQKCNTVSDVLQQQAVTQGEVITLCCHSDNSHVCGWNKYRLEKKHNNGLPGEGEI